MSSNLCCPPFDPAQWDGKTLQWQDKKFIKDSVVTLWYVPLNFGRVMKRLDAKVRKAGGAVLDNLCLSDHVSKWKMNVYAAVDKEIAGAENVTLGGTFFSKVYEGPYKDTGKWCKDFEVIVKSQGLSIQQWYMWYTTCPKCAKKYGKNYVVLIARTG